MSLQHLPATSLKHLISAKIKSYNWRMTLLSDGTICIQDNSSNNVYNYISMEELLKVCEQRIEKVKEIEHAD